LFFLFFFFFFFYFFYFFLYRTILSSFSFLGSAE
jgi:hypothetical protein